MKDLPNKMYIWLLVCRFGRYLLILHLTRVCWKILTGSTYGRKLHLMVMVQKLYPLIFIKFGGIKLYKNPLFRLFHVENEIKKINFSSCFLEIKYSTNQKNQHSHATPLRIVFQILHIDEKLMQIKIVIDGKA